MILVKAVIQMTTGNWKVASALANQPGWITVLQSALNGITLKTEKMEEVMPA
jgi:hypothetical protein